MINQYISSHVMFSAFPSYPSTPITVPLSGRRSALAIGGLIRRGEEGARQRVCDNILNHRHGSAISRRVSRATKVPIARLVVLPRK
jgi:hypothetical protein